MKHLIFRTIIALWKVVPLKLQLLKLIRKTQIDLSNYYRDFWINGIFEVRGSDTRFKLQATKDDKGTLEIFWKGLDNCWDAGSIKVWNKLARNSDVIFDIGSNMGLYCISAKAANPNAKVYAFEPSVRALKLLRKNIEINNLDIKVFETALSNTNSNSTFYDLDTHTAIASLKPNDNIIGCKNLNKYDVKTERLETFTEMNKIQKINLISIDVEMNEPELLEGMGPLIGDWKPDFIIEVLNNEVGAQIEKHFANHNYLYYSIDEESKKLSPSIHLSRSNSNQTKSFNFLVCKPSTAEYLELKTIV